MRGHGRKYEIRMQQIAGMMRSMQFNAPNDGGLMARDYSKASPVQNRTASKAASRDEFYSKLFTRLSVAVFLTMAASVAVAAVLFNQGV